MKTNASTEWKEPQIIEEWEVEMDLTCEYCGGDGGDPWNDGVLPCPECHGEGYRWWE